jgi:hypothetical protein
MSNAAATVAPVRSKTGAKFNGHATLTVLESPREAPTELADSSHPYGEQLAMMDETQRGLEDILVSLARFEEREFNHNSGVYKVKVKLWQRAKHSRLQRTASPGRLPSDRVYRSVPRG